MIAHPLYEKILECIKSFRHKKGISQKEMARLIGIKQSQYAKIENNQLELKISLLLRLVEIMEVDQKEIHQFLDSWIKPSKRGFANGVVDQKLIKAIVNELLNSRKK